MKTKLLKQLRKKSRDNIRLSRDRLTGEYVVHEKQYDVRGNLYYFEEMLRTEDRKAAEAGCRNLRRNYILGLLGRKTINF